MGTRGLTAVMLDGKYKLAQYNQWDSYPNGQGKVALAFCKKWLTDNDRASQFISNLSGCRYVPFSEISQFYKDNGIGTSYSFGQLNLFNKRYPYFSRDHGAKILEMIATDGPGDLQDEINFAGDSLMCEWAYVIDLDQMTFEVYKGFNKTPLKESDRFYSEEYLNFPMEHQAKPYQYTQIRMVMKFDINALPEEDIFLSYFKVEDDE